ncbi:MAG: IS1634 family transposase [Bacteroidota bacterium]|nr:IS1634 family transposase [Bacteroidota bacterium]
MFYIRTTKTTSGARAVQIVQYQNRKTIIVQHIGSSHDEQELTILKQTARDWIETNAHQTSLFPSSRSTIIPLQQCQYLGFRYGLLYETLNRLLTMFKFHLLHNKLLTDLVIARIAEPGSKLQSLAFLKQYFGIEHQRRLPQLSNMQPNVETKVLAVAKKEFQFNFSMVFYDVTTLYFESFDEDNLRKPGFSKDNKIQQPQILIGLLVTTEGFPVAYQIFEGNTFEGHTLIPIIKAFKRKHKIGSLTVVADAAMISLKNIIALTKSNLHYVVAARTANLSTVLIAKVSTQLDQRDGATVRIPTEGYVNLICEFSTKRFAKDYREMQKQIKKAEELLQYPSLIKRTKFIKSIGQNKYTFNIELAEKNKLLLGMKGYYTNLGKDVRDRLIIEHYHNLWRVEQVFRIAKSDLQMRPMYHFKEHTIKAHVLICFMALAICKYMELKSGKSTKNIVKTLKGVTDARILNQLTMIPRICYLI